MYRPILLLLAAVVLCGCARSSPTSYYLLEGPEPAFQAKLMPVKSMRVAQVYVPGYLNRNNIVSRIPDNTRLVLADFHLWAEPVGAGVRRVIEEVLTQPLLEAGIAVLPAGTDSPGDYVLTVDLLHLDGNFNEKAVLECRWTLYDRDERAVRRGLFAAQEKVDGADYNILVSAESKLVRDFAAYLAQQLIPPMQK